MEHEPIDPNLPRADGHQRVWLPICGEDDELTARLVCTYLEAEHLESRVRRRDGRFVVEVPIEEFEYAMRVYGRESIDPDESPVVQEIRQATSIHTVRRMREALHRRGVDVGTSQVNTKRPRLGVVVFAAAISAAAAAALWWLFFGPR